EVGRDGRPVAAQRGDTGHAGDDNTFHQHKPPFTARTWRVMYPASSDIRKFTAPATSSGVPMRAAGIIRRISSTGTCSSRISVSISPGATQLTVILRLPSSIARALAAPITPALEAL